MFSDIILCGISMWLSTIGMLFFLLEIEYEVKVYTGNQVTSGTNAHVYLIMYSANNFSREFALKESSTNKNKFERYSTDKFTFKMLSLGWLIIRLVW